MKKHINSNSIIICLQFGSLLWMLSIIIAPILKTSDINVLVRFSELLYYFYKPLCHQIPERSLLINSEPFAVCSRCFAVYFGAFFIILFTFLKQGMIKINNKIILLISLSVFFDFIFEKIGLYSNIVVIRLITGVLFGMCISYLIILSILESKNNKINIWKLNNGKSKTT